jgi:hypothetical protein
VSPDSSASEPATLEMQVLRNGELLGQAPLQLPKDLGQAFPYVASLKTDSLSAGNYDVRLSLAQGEKIIERERAFSIAGPELAHAELGKTGPIEQSGVGQNEASLTTADASVGEEVLPTRREPLVITSLPTNSVSRPSQDEMDTIIAGATKHAVNYAAKLPNFLCVEVTDRSMRWEMENGGAKILSVNSCAMQITRRRGQLWKSMANAVRSSAQT